MTAISGLTRNASRTQGYQPGYADQQARARRFQARPRQHATRRGPGAAQSPQHWPPRAGAKPVISHETIYRFIYAQIARKKDYACPGPKPKQGA